MQPSSPHTIAGAEDGTVDAVFALSGPDGGMCAHELPLLEVTGDYQPTFDSSTNSLVFGAISADSAAFLQSRFQSVMHSTANGGFHFAAVVQLVDTSMPSFPMTVEMADGRGMWLSLDSSGFPSFSYQGSSGTYSETGTTSLNDGTWAVIQCNYDAATHACELRVNGASFQSTAVQSGVRAACAAMQSCWEYVHVHADV
jgi:hypothetical protein